MFSASELIQAVKRHRIIFDYTMTDHFKKPLVDKAWEEVAAELGGGEDITAKFCKKEFKKLRDNRNQTKRRYKKKFVSGTEGSAEPAQNFNSDALAFLDEVGKDMSRQRVSNVNVRRGSQRDTVSGFDVDDVDADDPGVIDAATASIQFANPAVTDCCAEIARVNERRNAELELRPPPGTPRRELMTTPPGIPMVSATPVSSARRRLGFGILSGIPSATSSPRLMSPRLLSPHLQSPRLQSPRLQSPLASPGIGIRRVRRLIRAPERFSPQMTNSRMNNSITSNTSARSAGSASSRVSARGRTNRRGVGITFDAHDMHTILEDTSEAANVNTSGVLVEQVEAAAQIHNDVLGGLQRPQITVSDNRGRGGSSPIQIRRPPRVQSSPAIQREMDLNMQSPPHSASPGHRGGGGGRRGRGGRGGQTRAAERLARNQEAERERRRIQLFHEERRAALRDNIEAQQAALNRRGRPEVQPEQHQGPSAADGGADVALLRQFLTEKDQDVYGAWGQTMACILRGMRAPVSGKAMVDVHSILNKIAHFTNEEADEYLAEPYMMQNN